jgi:hypothetical protein
VNKDTLNAAIEQAERFVKLAKACRANADVHKAISGQDWLSFHPKDSGATKRASMDLTRALANLRRPG